MASAALHGEPSGLFVVIVIVIVFPKSLFPGVYVNEKGDEDEDSGTTEPEPFSVILTDVALPPNELLPTVLGMLLHVVPLYSLRLIVGGLWQAF